jgi:hypothetical protein
MFQVLWHGKIVSFAHHAGFQVETGIDIEAGGVFEQLPETAEQAAFVFIVKTFIENFGKFRSSDSQAERSVCIARQVCRQAMKPTEVRDENGLTQRAQRIRAVKKILLLNHFVHREMT